MAKKPAGKKIPPAPRKGKAKAKPAAPKRKAGRKPVPSRGTKISVSAASPALPIFIVDAFTTRPFHGNPAAVVVAEHAPSDATMQQIAAENNLSETAFVTLSKSGLRIRWFTPKVEVNLCGHATLAAAHVLWQHIGVPDIDLTFASRAGKLNVARHGEDLYELDFPAQPGEAVPITPEMSAAIGRMPSAAYLSEDLMLVLENRRDVYQLLPDYRLMLGLEGRGVIVTAPGSGHDFVSRCFYPKLGVNEDPVTGSAHCTLTPYWSSVLGKAKLRAHQVSQRGGELWCTLEGERVYIAGHAVTYSAGAVVAV
jgi:PhzF family phenazine biosynthesis protein